MPGAAGAGAGGERRGAACARGARGGDRARGRARAAAVPRAPGALGGTTALESFNATGDNVSITGAIISTINVTSIITIGDDWLLLSATWLLRWLLSKWGVNQR